MKKLLFFIAIVLFTVASCEKSDTTDDGRSIIGTWQCIGFGNTEISDAFKEIEPKDCEKCFVLTFKEDGSCGGFAVSNEIAGSYTLNRDKQELKPNIHMVTEINELYDGNLYLSLLGKVANYSFSDKGELLLYYNDQKEWLIFKSK